MTSKTPPQVVPKLRFPEFESAPAWGCPPLKKLATRVTQRNTQGQDLRPLTNSAEHGVVDQRDYFDKDIATTTNNYFVVEPGDYVYNPRVSSAAPVGPISKNAVGTGVMSPLYTVFRFRSEANDYFAHYFKSSHWHTYLRRASNSGARHDRMAITNDDFMGMPIPTPKPPEQQKIADCLGSLDDLIAAEGRKLEALRRHKQGLMQQLFPQPGETVPQLRFPEFEDAGDWEWKPLGKVAEIKLGKMLDKNKHRSGHLLPYLNNLAVRWNDFDTSDLPTMYFADNDLEKYALRTGDVVVCEGGEPGRAAVWDERVPSMKFQKALHRVRFTESFVPQLLVHYLETVVGTDSFESMFTGGGIKHLTRQTFASLEIPVAIPAEQQRIAACLSVIQEQVQGQQSRVQLLAMHKGGLLQQLFPSAEAFAS